MKELINYQTIKSYPSDKIALCALDYWQDTDYQAFYGLFYGLDGDDFVALHELIQNSKLSLMGIIGEVDMKAAIIWDEKAQGTAGGTFTSGAWRQRDLNTKLDPDNLVTVSANAVTIAVAGKYLIRANAPGHAVDTHQLRLTKNGSQLAVGGSEYSPLPNYYGYTRATVSTVATLEINDIIRLEHRCQTSYNNYGLGYPQTWGVNIYGIMELIQWT